MKHRDWRVRLDQRIDRCPGCDDWRFDGICFNCDMSPGERRLAELRRQTEEAA